MRDDVGLIAGPVTITRLGAEHRSAPGVVAVALSAVITLTAVAGVALAGRADSLTVLAGTVLPALGVAGVGAAHLLARRRGGPAECRFTLRTETGRLRPCVLRGAVHADVLRTGDLVRFVPGRWGGTGAVEVLAGLTGPVIRRVTGGGALPPVQWAGLGTAAALLALTVVVLYGP